jgi:hypothetical protein
MVFRTTVGPKRPETAHDRPKTIRDRGGKACLRYTYQAYPRQHHRRLPLPSRSGFVKPPGGGGGCWKPELWHTHTIIYIYIYIHRPDTTNSCHDQICSMSQRPSNAVDGVRAPPRPPGSIGFMRSALGLRFDRDAVPSATVEGVQRWHEFIVAGRYTRLWLTRRILRIP